MIVPTPAVELAELAAECIGYERLGGYRPEAARTATLDMLTDRARELGIAAGEIAGMVEAAIAAATGAAR